MPIARVGIVGGGQMGGGIAEVCAKVGVDVVIVEVSDDLAERSRAGIAASLDKAVDRGKLDSDGRAAALANMTFTTDLELFSDRELVIEAVVENLDVKRDLFARIDRVVDRGSIVSLIRLMRFSHRTLRRSRSLRSRPRRLARSLCLDCTFSTRPRSCLSLR